MRKSIVFIALFGLMGLSSAAMALQFNPNPAPDKSSVQAIGQNFGAQTTVWVNRQLVSRVIESPTSLRFTVNLNVAPGAKRIVRVDILNAGRLPQVGYLVVFGPPVTCDYKLTLRNLAALRSALSIYYGDTEGLYPAKLGDLVPKYIPSIPIAHICNAQGTLVPDSSAVHNLPSQKADNSGGWGYVPAITSSDYGAVFVNHNALAPDGIAWDQH